MRQALVRARRPLIFVPGILGSTLVATHGRAWGTLRECYAGPVVHREGALRSTTLLRAMTVVPGIYAFDVFASFERALHAHGFVTGETWLPLAYDWRLPLLACARLVRDEIVRASDRAGGPVDVIGFSTGGLAVRAAVSCPLDDEQHLDPLRGRVTHVIFAGTPQRGSLDGPLSLLRGDRLAPFGRWVEPDEMTGVGGAFDIMPWGRTSFRDAGGHDLALDVYDPAIWRSLQMGIFAGVSQTTWRFVGSHHLSARRPPSAAMVEHFGASLAGAADFHRRIEDAAALAALSSFCVHVVGGAGRATPAWLIVDRGRAYDPKGLPRTLRNATSHGLAPGDGLVDDASLRALPKIDSLTRIEGALHRTLITQPALHAAVLDAISR